MNLRTSKCLVADLIPNEGALSTPSMLLEQNEAVRPLEQNEAAETLKQNEAAEPMKQSEAT